MRDTAPARISTYARLLRAQAGHERLRTAALLTQAVRELATAGIRREHPNACEEELRNRLAVRLYGRAFALQMLGSIPDDAR